VVTEVVLDDGTVTEEFAEAEAVFPGQVIEYEQPRPGHTHKTRQARSNAPFGPPTVGPDARLHAVKCARALFVGAIRRPARASA